MAQKKRRGRGEGLIRQRPDGRWEARLDLGWQGGKRVRKTLYGRTWEDVRNKLDDARHSEQQGLLHAGPTTTVGQFLRSWLEVVQPGLRPKTYTSYEGTVPLHLLPDFEKVRLDKLTPIHVHRLLKRKASEGDLSERSVQYILFVLRIALGKAVRWGLVARNVATMVDGPRVHARNVPALTPEQASVFIEAAREDRLSALYTVALSLGLRQGEALGLRWSNVDMDRRELQIDAALQRVPGKGLVLVEPKTERSQRVIALPRVCADALREHRKRQLEDRLLAGSRWTES